MTDLTANDALDIISRRAQSCRENGDSDMRSILYTANFVRQSIAEGKSREEILAEFVDEDE
jgi:hypothetical protein